MHSLKPSSWTYSDLAHDAVHGGRKVTTARAREQQADEGRGMLPMPMLHCPDACGSTSRSTIEYYYSRACGPVLPIRSHLEGVLARCHIDTSLPPVANDGLLRHCNLHPHGTDTRTIVPSLSRHHLDPSPCTPIFACTCI